MLRLVEALDAVLLVLGAKVEDDLALGVAIDGAHGQSVRLEIVCD